MDVFVDLPEVVHRQLPLSSAEPTYRNENETRTLAVSFLRRLQAWRSGWDDAFPARPEVQHSSWPDIGLEPLWPVGLGFPNLEEAEALSTYNAICMLLLNKAFKNELGSLHCTHCTSEYTSSTVRKARVEEFTKTESAVQKLDRFYHEIITDACNTICYYWASSSPKPQPIDVLIPLRHVWLITRNMKCPIASWLDSAMCQILASDVSGLPLYLHEVS